MKNRLKEYREAADLRQCDVADLLGFASTDRISRWEQGQTFPHMINLFKLAAIYSVLPHELYDELWAETHERGSNSHSPSQGECD